MKGAKEVGAFKINSTWIGFDLDIKNLKIILRKKINVYPKLLLLLMIIIIIINEYFTWLASLTFSATGASGRREDFLAHKNRPLQLMWYISRGSMSFLMK